MLFRSASNLLVVELPGEGTDTVQSSVTFTLGADFENLIITGSAIANGTGSASANILTGNGAANLLKGMWANDTLSGGAGDDTLAGNGSNDSLTGGTGADKFYFDTALNATTNVDVITDFTVANDKIQLDDDIFTSLPSAISVTVAAGQFISGAGLTAARDADDFLIYNTSTGDLYYDSDGNGAAVAVKFAVLTGLPALGAGDFIIVN